MNAVNRTAGARATVRDMTDPLVRYGLAYRTLREAGSVVARRVR